ncbi:hypothetical protein C8Q74DRAFT_680565 [Fomes fomentarius]|nr:hypothetical protein C8Q74DRAFT_680565 [Fomes fomentarius]
MGCRRASPLNPSSFFLSLFPLSYAVSNCVHDYAAILSPLPSLSQSTTDLVGYIPVPVTLNNLNQFPVLAPSPPLPTLDSDSNSDSDSKYSFTRCLRYLFRPRPRAEAQSASVYRVVEFSSPSPLFVTLSR